MLSYSWKYSILCPWGFCFNCRHSAKHGYLELIQWNNTLSIPVHEQEGVRKEYSETNPSPQSTEILSHDWGYSSPQVNETVFGTGAPWVALEHLKSSGPGQE